MRILESAGLIKSTYRKGVRGVRKIYTTDLREVRLILE